MATATEEWRRLLSWIKNYWQLPALVLEFRLRKDKTVQQKESDAHQCADWKIQLFKLAEVAFECEL